MFLGDFEPVYYDGDIKFKKFDRISLFKEDILKLSFNRKYKFPFVNSITDDEFENRIYLAFKRTIQNKNKDYEFLKKNLEIFRENIIALQKIVENYSNYIDYKKYLSTTVVPYVDRVTDKNIDQDHIIDVKFRDNEFIIKYLNGTKKNITTENLSNLISKMTLFNTRAILIKNKYNFYKILELENKDFLDGSFIKSSGINMNINTKKKLEIFQETSNDWILFKNITFENWTIEFNGKKTYQIN